jgi:hypothetical protein
MSGPTAKQQAEWQRRLLVDRRGLLDSPAFCRVLWDFLEQSGLFRTSFAGESAHITAFQEGVRSNGLRVFAELTEAVPDALARLQAHAMPVTVSPDPEDLV